MNQEIDYSKKYLKYKSKYYLLKKSIGGSEQSNDSPLSWKNEPNFVPEFNDPTVKSKDQNCENSALKIYNFVVKKKNDKKDDQEGSKKSGKKDGKKVKIIKYKWCDDEAKDVLSLNSGIRNQNVAEVVNSLFLEFIAKIYNITSDGRTLTLFSIDFDANKAKCQIKLNISHQGQKYDYFSEALGWHQTTKGLGLGSKDDRYKENFYVSWKFFNEKTNKEELFDESKHFKDGFFGKVKKATIDGKEIDIEKFKSKQDRFKSVVRGNMNLILQEFAGMINNPRSDNCNDFLKKFHSFWNQSHLFYESIKK